MKKREKVMTTFNTLDPGAIYSGNNLEMYVFDDASCIMTKVGTPPPVYLEFYHREEQLLG